MKHLPNIMDFEASGPGTDSFPIEVGYCLSSGERYSTLIRPAESWQHWDQRAERLHKIPRQLLLEKGQSLAAVAQSLNRRLSGQVLFSDSWVVDKTWLNQIYAMAGIAPTFELKPIERIQSECQYLTWGRMKQNVMQGIGEQRHRASTDARIVQRVFVKTLAECRPQHLSMA